MARQVQQLLHLAEVSERQNYQFEMVGLAEIIGETFEHLRRLAERIGISLILEQPSQEFTVRADRGASFVLLKNFLENAIHHSPRGSKVIVTSEGARIAVRDCGDGIPAQDFSMLYKRFWRRAGRRDEGAGLGLAICLEIATAHGWTLAAPIGRRGNRRRIERQLTI